jgi:hypothetical protein
MNRDIVGGNALKRKQEEDALFVASRMSSGGSIGIGSTCNGDIGSDEWNVDVADWRH